MANPILQDISCGKNRRGALVAKGGLEVSKCPGLWAIGECALVWNPDTGEP